MMEEKERSVKEIFAKKWVVTATAPGVKYRTAVNPEREYGREMTNDDKDEDTEKTS
jgi:hypothetical protein